MLLSSYIFTNVIGVVGGVALLGARRQYISNSIQYIMIAMTKLMQKCENVRILSQNDVSG